MVVHFATFKFRPGYQRVTRSLCPRIRSSIPPPFTGASRSQPTVLKGICASFQISHLQLPSGGPGAHARGQVSAVQFKTHFKRNLSLSKQIVVPDTVMSVKREKGCFGVCVCVEGGEGRGNSIIKN